MRSLSVVPVASLNRSKLRSEIDSLFKQTVRGPELESAGIRESDYLAASPTDIRVEQKAGFVGEPIIITFASTVAYDIWKKLILPHLEKKYGGKPFIHVQEHEEK